MPHVVRSAADPGHVWKKGQASNPETTGDIVLSSTVAERSSRSVAGNLRLGGLKDERCHGSARYAPAACICSDLEC
jgi:hypothetical protein